MHIIHNFSKFLFSCIILACIVVCITAEFRCGDYGFVCLDDYYFKKCDKQTRQVDHKIEYKCPENTICDESWKRACKDDDSSVSEDEVKEISEIMTSNYQDLAKPSQLNLTAETGHVIHNTMPSTIGKAKSKSSKPKLAFKRRGDFSNRYNLRIEHKHLKPVSHHQKISK